MTTIPNKTKYTVIIIIGLVGVIAVYLFLNPEILMPGEDDAALPITLKVEEIKVNPNMPTEPEEFVAETTELIAVGGYTGEGLSTREYDDISFVHTVVAKLDDPQSGKFYEGWLVKTKPKLEFISTGKLNISGGGYALTFTSKEDLRSFNQVVVTEETLANGLDNKPETHILEGEF